MSKDFLSKEFFRIFFRYCFLALLAIFFGKILSVSLGGHLALEPSPSKFSLQFAFLASFIWLLLASYLEMRKSKKLSMIFILFGLVAVSVLYLK